MPRSESYNVDYFLIVMYTSSSMQQLEARSSIVFAEKPAPPPFNLTERTLGSGGYATIHEGKTPDDRLLAVKVFKPLKPDTFTRQNPQREAALLARLSHPNIVKFYGFDYSAEGQARLWTELVQGESLYQLVNREGAMPFDEALCIGLDITRAIRFAHGEGIVHADIKPHNVMKSPEGAKVIDWGLAFDLSNPPVNGDQMEASPMYSSPEQVTAGATLTEATDVYSTAITLFTLLTAKNPYGKRSENIEYSRAHLYDPPAFLPDVLNTGDMQVVVLGKALAEGMIKDPAKRVTMKTFEKGLQRAARMQPPRPTIITGARVVAKVQPEPSIVGRATVTPPESEKLENDHIRRVEKYLPHSLKEQSYYMTPDGKFVPEKSSDAGLRERIIVIL